MTEIIAIASEKGGVAKTTTTLSLGGALVESGKDVLAIDLDPQANLSLALGVQPSRLRRSSADVLLNSSTILSVSRETNLPGLDLVPANAELGLAERFLPIRQNYTLILRSALSGVGMYDYILIDCPPSLGAITLNALSAADRLIIPTQAEYFSAYALRSMLAAVQKVQGMGNPALDYAILITMFDARNRIHRVLYEQIRARFGERVLDTMIQVDTKLRESTIVGLPITHFARSSRSAQQYRALAQELTHDVKETVSQPA
jgi:chromosome partitioning protein